MNLFYRRLGQGSPLIILHGLFGMSDNWLTIARRFANHFEVWLPDMRNHGRSPHNPEFNYDCLVQDVAAFMAGHQIEKANLLGHSMGGKIAMGLALSHSSRVQRLIVADIAPRAYVRPYFKEFLTTLKSIDLSNLKTRRQADERMQQDIPQLAVRQFLLKNLYRDDQQQFRWRINIAALYDNIDNILGEAHLSGQWPGPALFLRGEKSDYITEQDMAHINQLFPQARLYTLARAGHWVHTEAADELYNQVLHFLES